MLCEQLPRRLAVRDESHGEKVVHRLLKSGSGSCSLLLRWPGCGSCRRHCGRLLLSLLPRQGGGMLDKGLDGRQLLVRDAVFESEELGYLPGVVIPAPRDLKAAAV